MNNLFKKTFVMMTAVTTIFFYSGGMKEASAAQVTKSFDYTCIASTSLAGEIEIGMKVTPKVSVPDVVAPNGNIAVENIVTDIEVDLTGSLAPLKALINPFNGHVSQFNLQANGNSVNAIGAKGAKIPETPFDDSATAIPFSIKGVNSNLKAGEEDIDIKVGEIKAEIYAKLGSTPVDLPVTCTPPADNVLTTVTVDEGADPGEDPGKDPGEDPGKDPGEDPKEPVDPDPTDPKDVTAPKITLNGENPMKLYVGETYNEPGAKAEDDVDGDLTNQIKITGSVDTKKAGKYEIVYSVIDAAGNETKVTRVIEVIEKTKTPIKDDDNNKQGDDNGTKPDDDDNKSGDDGKGTNPSDDDNKPGNNTGIKPGVNKKPSTNINKGQTGLTNNNGKGTTLTKTSTSGKPTITSRATLPKTSSGATLPKTATNNPLFLLIGTIFVVSGATVLIIRKRVLQKN